MGTGQRASPRLYRQIAIIALSTVFRSIKLLPDVADVIIGHTHYCILDKTTKVGYVNFINCKD